jgi:uncharacterized cupin superfamily protein
MSASLIGGIGISRVVVYGQRPSPDGQHGGSPHIHSVTEEAYYVTKGTGWVELHDLERGFRRMRKDSPVNGTSATVFRLTDCP